MSDIAMKMGAYMVMEDATLAKMEVGLAWVREEPHVVFLGMKTCHQPEFQVVWRVSREVLANAAFNNVTASDDPDFIIEPTMQALEGVPNIPAALQDTMFCHLTGLSWDDIEQHEHIIFSGQALREFLGDTDKLVPLEAVKYEAAVDVLLADIFK